MPSGEELVVSDVTSPSRMDKIRYIQAMLGELRTMAEAERSDLLTYMIEMAYIEASDIVRGERPLRVSEQKGNSIA